MNYILAVALVLITAASSASLAQATQPRCGQFELTGGNKTIDLVVRTHTALPQPMQQGIRSIYLDTLTALGFAGNLAFQVADAFDATPVEATVGPRKDLRV